MLSGEIFIRHCIYESEHLSAHFFGRLIVAQWFLGHIVAGGFVGAGTAPAANPLVFTGTAFACQLIIIAEITKNIGMLPNFTKTGLCHVTAV